LLIGVSYLAYVLLTSIGCYHSEISETVKPKRAYNSTRRQAQAQATRRVILEVAERLFVTDGYVATTIEGIATESGVSAKTVYDAFATKSGLLRGVWDLALKGDTDDAPVEARPWFLQVVEEPDPARIVKLIVRQSVEVKQRIGPVLRVIRAASSVDDDSAALWTLIQSDFHANQRALVAAIAKRKGLKVGLSVDRAADILWMLNHPDTWLALHDDRGWSAKEFEKWFAATAAQQLLK
jgi:AcrR family transcriptional regulator